MIQTREEPQGSSHGLDVTFDPQTPGVRAHACIKHIPPWADDDPRMEALRVAVQGGAPVPAILITARHEIVCAESFNHWRAAKALQIEAVSVQIVADDQVATAALGALLHRRHLTKAARAFLAYPLMERAHIEAKQRRLEMLKKGNVFPLPTESATGKSIADLVAALGISRDVFEQAARVHALFAKHPEYAAQMIPKILAEPIGGEHENMRPVGLGAVLAGWEGKQNEDKPRQDGTQLELFTDSVGTLFKRFMYWAGFDPASRKAALQKIRNDIAKLPPDQCSELADLLRTLAKEASARGGEK